MSIQGKINRYGKKETKLVFWVEEDKHWELKRVALERRIPVAALVRGLIERAIEEHGVKS